MPMLSANLEKSEMVIKNSCSYGFYLLFIKNVCSCINAGDLSAINLQKVLVRIYSENIKLKCGRNYDSWSFFSFSFFFFFLSGGMILDLYVIRRCTEEQIFVVGSPRYIENRERGIEVTPRALGRTLIPISKS